MTIKKESTKLYNWASIIDDQTKAQAETTASMPFVSPHLALMPDAHLGKGATVGSVIPTDRAIIPAAVGVDIGCVDADTEFLSPTGWVRIADYGGEMVAQYDTETGKASFVEPQRYIVREQEEFLHFKTKYGIDQALTPDHRVLAWKTVGRDRRQEMVVLTAQELADEHARLKLGAKYAFETSFELEAPVLGQGLSLSDDELRLHVAVSADAHVAGRHAVFHLKKERKIDRLLGLLGDLQYAFKITPHDDGTTTIRTSHQGLPKGLESLWFASPRQLRVIVSELFHWDGSASDGVFFTRVKEEADFAQYALSACGYRAVMREDLHARDGAVDYRVFRHDRTRVGLAGSPKSEIATIPAPDGKAYCFTVPTGFLVLRRNGNVFITGNCGMIAVKTQWTEEELRAKADLTFLRQDIEARIPMSAGKYNRDLTDSARTRIGWLMVLWEDLRNDYNFKWGDDAATFWLFSGDLDAYAPNWDMQLGTLGSGNHFVEIVADENGAVWAFLHSGSRGIGNKIAQHHIKVAQEECEKWWIPLPDKDLAYLAEGAAEFDRYIAELQWAQEFARLNREEMMDRTLAALEAEMGDEVHRQEEVNCHHNFTQKENHFGKNLWISRKGAISAREGELGLVPGSMGTASYVVRGLGNRMSFCSSPHGAGREFSRSKARKTFTIEQLREAMTGIEYRDTDAFIDEIPSAYKDIDRVMEDASDLVEVVHQFHQIINCKGS